ncbi:phage tail protein, partial [Pseudomonas tolaasii]|nr:phage tail protein [Pseudomonas tolaasii]
WRAWKKLSGAGANTDITSLSGLTTALSVSQGGTGGKTQADARAGLGLGSAATATVGTSVGNVMAVGAGGLLGVAIGIPQGTALSLVQKTQFSTTSSNADVPAAAPYSTLITIKYPEGFRQSELAANILDGSLYSRVTLANGATTPWRKIYDDTNTTRAADGTLKAI